MISLDPRNTAIVLIDLQKGVVGMPLRPHSASAVVNTSTALVERFSKARAFVVFIIIAWVKDLDDTLRQRVDRPSSRPLGGHPEGWGELVDSLCKPGDILVTKHQWGGFYGTDLDVQLRRRAIKTIVLGGIATSIGVESTARQAWQHGYDAVVAEVATTSISAEMHAFSISEILPRISRVTKAGDISLRKD
jgi:nicotinamidase-related amidase